MAREAATPSSLSKNQTHSAPCETRLRVRYAETDQMGVVYHSNFIIWFEVGRVEAMRQLGFSYKQMEHDGCHLPVVEVRCRFKAPALYDEEILVRTHIKNLRASMIHFVYEVVRADDGTLLAEGETIHFTVDDQGNKRRFPEKYMHAMRAALGR
jgi:acyl-CoA thioester hydrolase